MRHSQFHIETSAEGETMFTILAVGELDLAVVDQLHHAAGLAAGRDRGVLCVDLCGVTFIDSSGLACLIKIRDQCRRVGARLEILASPAVSRLVAMVGADLPLINDACTQ
jgi:anti-anti-sigma factor